MVAKDAANKKYAIAKAPFPRTRVPLESIGASSVPIITESDPVPKGSPNAMRLQNSTDAQAKGKAPIKKTQTSEFCNSPCIFAADSSAISIRKADDPLCVDVNVNGSSLLDEKLCRCNRLS